MTRQICGSLYWVKREQPNNKTPGKFLVIEVDKNMSQGPEPVILIIAINSLITQIRLVHNLDKALQKETKSFNAQNRYFYRRINILKPDSYQNILNSTLTLLKHV
ncbi:MAG: hypothetical protein ABIP37_04625 [Methylotenera sp.]